MHPGDFFSLSLQPKNILPSKFNNYRYIFQSRCTRSSQQKGYDKSSLSSVPYFHSLKGMSFRARGGKMKSEYRNEGQKYSTTDYNVTHKIQSSSLQVPTSIISVPSFSHGTRNHHIECQVKTGLPSLNIYHTPSKSLLILPFMHKFQCFIHWYCIPHFLHNHSPYHTIFSLQLSYTLIHIFHFVFH